MGWDRKKRGPVSGYFYVTKRVPGKPHPVKVYMGRRAAGREAAAELERRKQARRAAKETIRAERDATAEADRLAAELSDWAEALTAAWLVLAGHHHHRGEWRRRHG